MRTRLQRLLPLLRISIVAIVALAPAPARADKYDDAIKAFRNAGESGTFFEGCYGYAVFPTIGKGGFGIGGARGSGRVYVHGAQIGEATMTQVTVGFQLGGQAYSQIIFFEDKRACDEFTSGNFEFGAQASAVAITLGASAEAGTGGTGASAGTSTKNTKTAGSYQKGYAVFTAAKGGLMYEASIGGQKFGYKASKK